MVSGSVGDIFVRLGIDPSGLSSGFNAAESRMEAMGNRLFYMGARMTAGVTVPVVAAATAITIWGLDFDQAMTESLAIMDDVSPQMRHQMEETAKTISEDTKFSAEEGAAAYYDLASAGLTAAESMGSLNTVAQFAQAGVMDLKEAGEFLAGAVSAVGDASLGTSGKIHGMAVMADLLTAANNYALGTVEDFANAITNKSGQALRMYNVDVKQGIAALMAYVEQNIKGKVAGNQLYITLRDLQRASQRNTKEWKALGIEVFNASGHMNPLSTIIRQMELAFEGMSDQQQHAAFSMLGMQDRSKAATLALIGMSDEMVRYEAILQNAGGTTAEVAAKQMLALKNQLLSLWHQFQNVGISIFQEFVPVIHAYLIPAFKAGIAHMRDVAKWLSTLSTEQKAYVLGVVALVAVLGPAIGLFGSFLLFIRALTAPLQLATRLLAAQGGSSMAGATASAGSAAATAASKVSLFSRGLSLLKTPATAWIGLALTILLGLKNLAGGWSDLYYAISGLSGGLIPLAVNQFRNLWNIAKSLGGIIIDLGVGAFHMLSTGMQVAVDWAGRLINKLEDVGRRVAGWGLIDQSGVGGPGSLEGMAQNFRDYWRFQAEGGDAAVRESMKAALDALDEMEAERRGRLREISNQETMADIDQWIEILRTGAPLPDPHPWRSDFDARNQAEIDAERKKAGELLDWRFRVVEESKRKEQEWLDNQVLMRDYATGELMDVDRRYLQYRMDMEEAYIQHVAQNGLYIKNANDTLQTQLLDNELARVAALEQIDHEYLQFKQDLAVQEIEVAEQKMRESGEYARMEYRIMKESGTASAAAIQAKWEEWYAKDYEHRHSQLIGWRQTLKTLADSFEQLANIAGGSFGEMVRWIGTVLSSMSLAADGAQAMDKGLKQIGDGQITAGIANLASGIVSVAGAFMQATSSASKFKNAVGGALVGAQVGAQFGGAWGAAIGAAVGGIAGLFRGQGAMVNDMRDKWFSQFGLTKDRQFQGLVDKLAEAGVTGGEAERLIRAIYNADTVSEFEAAVLAVNLAMEDGRAEMEATSQAAQQQASNAQAFVSGLSTLLTEVGSSGRLASKEMLGLVQQVENVGEAGEAVDKFVTQQIQSAITGLQTFLQTGAAAYTTLAEKQRALRELQAQANQAEGQERDEIKEKIIALTEEINRQHAVIQVTSIASQNAALAFGAAIAAAFTELQNRGMSVTEALQAITPSVNALQTQLEATGFTGGAAFDQIRQFVAIASGEVSGPALNAVSALNQGLVGLHNSGLLNQDMFSGLASQVAHTFTQLVAQGVDGDAALQLMQPTLQTIWELQQDFGYAVDAATQEMLNQAVAAGIVGQAHRDENEQIRDLLEDIKGLLQDFLELMQDAAEEAGDTAGAVEDIAAHANNLPENPFEAWNIPGPPDWEQYLPPGMEIPGFAHGTDGLGFADFGTGTLAMLHGREAIVPENMMSEFVRRHYGGPRIAAVAGPSRADIRVSDSRSNVHDDFNHAELKRIRDDMRRRDERLPIMIRDAILHSDGGRR